MTGAADMALAEDESVIRRWTKQALLYRSLDWLFMIYGIAILLSPIVAGIALCMAWGR